MTKQRVLIVDDVLQVRYELRTLLSLAGDVEVVGEAADGLEAIRLAETLQPEVILMDLEMRVLDGYERLISQTVWASVQSDCSDSTWLRCSPGESLRGGGRRLRRERRSSGNL